ncbi:MAG: hypothetical protein ACLFQB_04815 [Chitinispirillaceae bacterium]
MMDVLEYYRNPNIFRRMMEFLGGREFADVSALYVTQCDAPAAAELGSHFRPPEELPLLLSYGLDVSRSLWDRTSLIAHLDIEYVNFDFQAEPYLDPHRAFLLQKPSETAIQKFLLNFGIAPLHVLSGRGHHFVWRVLRNSAAYGKLTRIGRLPNHLARRYREKHPPSPFTIDHDLGAAYAGLGLLMEYVAYRVRREASLKSEIPVEITAVEVPPQQRGREMISVDITEYGDQLNTRVIRIPYSLYLKPWKKGGVLTDDIKDRIPHMVSIPLFEMDLMEGIECMRDFSRVEDLASKASVQIPEQSEQTLELIADYEISDVARYHDWYFSVEQKSAERWTETYDKAPLELLPPCTRFILENPNDLLLKPSGMQQVVRVFLSLGWHPREIAGLIRSKFERDYGWGNEWYFYDAAYRADFYTRVFSGLIESGGDDLKFFDCSPVRESFYCHDNCGTCSLDPYKKSLLERVKYERLACRPFNGLFLPDEHL